MNKLQGYMGDVGIRHGGYYWHMESADSDYADIVEVIPASDMGGPDNLFYIESGTVYLPGDERETRALESCGFPDAEGDSIEPWQRVDAMASYWGLDSRRTHIVQIGRDDPYSMGGAGFNMPDKGAITYLGEKTSLRGYVLANCITWRIEP